MSRSDNGQRIPGDRADVVLWHIPISHYSEKVRWALAYKGIEHERRAPLPGYHMLLALALTRGRAITLPVLALNGRPIGDSSAIIAALEQCYPEPPLLPAEAAARRRALEIEDFADTHLGPHVRRFAFHEAQQNRAGWSELTRTQAPPALARFGAMSAVYARAFTGTRFLAASATAAGRSRERILSAAEHLERELGDREFLAGNQFTVADLTVSSLMYPIVRPAEGPLSDLSAPGVERLREELAQRRLVGWVEEMFRRFRHRSGSRAASG